MDHKTVLGVYSERTSAENVINELESRGYNPKDVSIVMKDRDEARNLSESTGADVVGDATKGATTGAILGGLAGLVSAFAIPGLGAFFIGGPIAAALGLTGAAAATVSGATTGALAGGLVGALSNMGVSEEDARSYEKSINEGGILVAVPAHSGDEGEVRNLLESTGADQIKVLDQQDSRVQRTHTRDYEERQSSPAYFSEVSRDSDMDDEGEFLDEDDDRPVRRKK